MRLWGGATHKLKPSPFCQLRFSRHLRVVFCHLTVYTNSRPQITMPPRPTRNSNWEEDLVEEVESDSQTTSTGLLGTPVSPVPPEITPSTPYNALPDLAKAFRQLADSLNNTMKLSVQAWVREPDQFNESDTHKLQLFLTQCLLNFCDHPNAFSDDSAKVTYVLSFLHGTALDWFEPTLTSSRYAPWLTDYSAFISKLWNNFGPHDLEGEAEAGLKNLWMHDTQWITKYLFELNQLAARVQWGDTPLRHQLYNKLPPWIKDEISWVGKPDNLTDLCFLAQFINARYWECHSEITCKTPVNKSQDKSGDKGKTPATLATQNTNRPKSGQSSTPQNTPAPATSNTPKLTSTLTLKLGKDGRLTQEERQRRMDNNLCLFCSKPGHIANECLKATSTATKACTVTVEKAPVLSSRTLHGEVRRTRVDGKGLGFNLCVAPPHNRVVPNFGVMEFTEFTKVFHSIPERAEKTRGSCRWVHYGRYTNWCYHTWLFVYVSTGMYVSTKGKDNKTVMEHKKHDNQKWNITRIPEFQIRDKSENGEQ